MTQILGLSAEALEAITTVAAKAPFLLAYPAADIEFMVERLMWIRQGGRDFKINVTAHDGEKATSALEAVAAKIGGLADLVERAVARRDGETSDKSDQLEEASAGNTIGERYPWLMSQTHEHQKNLAKELDSTTEPAGEVGGNPLADVPTTREHEIWERAKVMNNLPSELLDMTPPTEASTDEPEETEDSAEREPGEPPFRCGKCRRIILMPDESELSCGECGGCQDRPAAPWESCRCPLGTKNRPAPLHYLECPVLEWWRLPSKFKAPESVAPAPEATEPTSAGEALIQEIERMEDEVEAIADPGDLVPFSVTRTQKVLVTLHDEPEAPSAVDEPLVCEACKAEASELVGGECAACVELVTLYTIGGSKVSVKRSNILREVDVDGRRMAATKTMGALYLEDPTATPPAKEVAKSDTPLADRLPEIAEAIARADARRVSVPPGFRQKTCDSCPAEQLLPEDRKSGRYRCWDHSKPDGQENRIRVIEEHLRDRVSPSSYATIASLVGVR